jgi:hypothetical protein
VIRLNGIGGVRFKTRIEKFDPGFSVKDFFILSEAKNLGSFLPQRWNE